MEAKPDLNGGMDLTSDVLEQQGRNLRALARSLLRDAHAADDVVQETWLAYFTHPAGAPSRVSAWLGTVARRLASRRMRGEGRRRAREEFAATRESVDALHEVALEREEALRVVTQALLALDEPFKSTLILRYFDERSPTRIAELQGLPLATVKSRIARGLERLRERLGTAFDGDTVRRTRALGLLAGVPLHQLVGGAATLTASAAPATVGTTSAATKAVCALAALCFVGVVLWTWNDELHAPLERVAESQAGLDSDRRAVLELASASALGVGRGDRQDATSERRAVAALDEPLADPLALLANETLFPYRVSGVVRDERDEPVSGARVYFAPRGFVVNSVAETDAEGRFAFEFDGRRATFDGVFAAAANETYLDLCEVQLVSGQEFTVDVAIRSSADADVGMDVDTWSIVFEPGGDAVDGAATDTTSSNAPMPVLVPSESIAATRGATWPLAYAPECLRLGNGRVCFVDPPPPSPCTRPAESSPMGRFDLLTIATDFEFDFAPALVQRDWSTSEFTVTFLDGRLHYESPAEPTPAPVPSVSGVARRADGTPAAGVRIAWRSMDGSCGDVATGADGAFALVDLPPGVIALQAGGGEDGIAHGRLELAEHGSAVWHPLLDRGAEIRGRVVDATSREPLANARVESWSTAGAHLWCDSTTTDADGRFALPNVPTGALELHVSAASGPNGASGTSVFPGCVLRRVFGGSDVGEIEVDARREALGAIALTVLDASGAPASDAQVIVWHTASGRGIHAGETDEPGTFALGALPSGSYRVEVLGSCGRLDVGAVALDPDADAVHDLGAVRLPPIGAALFVVEPTVAGADVSDVDLNLWSVHPDAFGHVASNGSRWTRAIFPLHAGPHVVWTSDASGATQRVPIDVPPGAAAGLTLEQSPNGALTPRAGAIDREIGPLASDAACAACHGPR